MPDVTTQSHTLDTPAGAMRLYEARPEGEARAAVIVIQEAFGVNEHIEDVTRRFAAEGFHAVAEADGIGVPWLGLFGDLDGSIPVDDVEQLREALQAAPAATDVVRYENAGHGFHCDVRPDYVERDAKDAWGRTIAWFELHLTR